MYQVSLEKFEGPLDLLLSTVEDRKLSINDISLADVADQYIGYLKSLEDMPKEELATFLVIASTLMLIKSRSLIPNVKFSEEEEADIKDLEHRLKMYKFFKALSLHIRDASKKNLHLFGREAYAGGQIAFLPPDDLKVDSIKLSIEKLLAVIPKKQDLASDYIRSTVSLEEKITELKNRLENTIKATFTANKDKVETIVSFLAMLELIKQGFLIFEQKQLFGNIELKKYKDSE